MKGEVGRGRPTHAAEAGVMTKEQMMARASKLSVFLMILWAGTLSAQGLPVADLVTDSSCGYLLYLGTGLSQSGNYDSSLKILESYIQTCAMQNTSWTAFHWVGNDMYNLDKSQSHYIEYREWLKSVLYLDTGTQYYCSDANEIIGTLQWFNDSLGWDDNGMCAIIKYIIQSNKCPDLDSILWSHYVADRKGQYQHWQDTVRVDTTIYKLDTTLPTLEDLGLGILRGPQNSVVSPKDFGQLSAIVLHSSENPFKSETEIWYDLKESRLIRFGIYDQLGREYTSHSLSKLQHPGRQTITIDGADLPSGIYYARVSAFDGEVRTLKIVKEE